MPWVLEQLAGVAVLPDGSLDLRGATVSAEFRLVTRREAGDAPARYLCGRKNADMNFPTDKSVSRKHAWFSAAADYDLHDPSSRPPLAVHDGPMPPDAPSSSKYGTRVLRAAAAAGAGAANTLQKVGAGAPCELANGDIVHLGSPVESKAPEAVLRARWRPGARADGVLRAVGGGAGRAPLAVAAEGVAIAVFAHKGGSLKTTTTVQLAAALADKGHKVCILDCDTQCNATQYFVDNPDVEGIDEDDYQARAELENYNNSKGLVEAGDHDGGPLIEPKCPADALCAEVDGYKMEHFLEGIDQGGNIKHWFDMVFKHNAVSALHKHLVARAGEEAADAGGGGGAAAAAEDSTQSLQMLHEVTDPDFKGKLWYVKGSGDLGLWEEEMSRVCSEQHRGNTNAEIREKRAVPHKILYELKHTHKFDFILVDLSPACSAMNKAWVMSSDYILPPVDPSAYGATGCAGLLTKLLPRWFAWHREVAAAEQQEYTTQMEDADPSGTWGPSQPEYQGLRMPIEPPLILPLTFGRYDVAEQNQQQVVTMNHANFVATTRAFFIQQIKGKGELKPSEALVLDRMVGWEGQRVMALIPRSVDVIPTSEALGRPVVTLRDDGQDYLDNYQFEVVDQPIGRKKPTPRKPKSPARAKRKRGEGGGGAAAAAAAVVDDKPKVPISRQQHDDYKRDVARLKERYGAWADFLVWRRQQDQLSRTSKLMRSV